MNLGLTCYVNATLQVLFHIPSMVDYLLQKSLHIRNCGAVQCETEGIKKIYCQLVKHLASEIKKTGRNPKPFVEEFVKHYEDFATGQQDDKQSSQALCPPIHPTQSTKYFHSANALPCIVKDQNVQASLLVHKKPYQQTSKLQIALQKTCSLFFRK